MAETAILRCPSCSAKMKTKAAPGVRVRCPKCKEVFRRADVKAAPATITETAAASSVAPKEAPKKNTPKKPTSPKPSPPTAEQPKPAPAKPAGPRRRTRDDADDRPAVSRKLLVTLGVLATIGVIAVACTFFPGSSDAGPDLGFVKGKVVYNGTPLTHGQIAFNEINDKGGWQGVGFIQPDGTFEMKTQLHKGALIGTHIVTVHCWEKIDPEKADGMVIPKSLIPEKYGSPNETPLRFEVKRGQNNCLLELRSP